MADEILTAQLYDIPEIARLAQLSPRTARRWLMGYEYTYKVGGVQRWGSQPALLRREVSDYACFLDLVELRLVRQLLTAGFTLQKLRAAFIEAEQVTGLYYPFARENVLVSGESSG